MLLLGTAVLVHAYLLVMVLAIFAADLLQRMWRREWNAGRALATLAVSLLLVGLLMWATGYFMLGGVEGVQVDQAAFGTYRMNLHALIDTENFWSRLLPDLPGGVGEYEGFAFLGLGILLLGAVALPLLIEARRPGASRAIWVPITAVAAGMAAFALSNHIALGSTDIVQYNVPAFAQPVTGAFRVAGRFFWPAYYLLITGLLVLIARGLRPATSRITMALMLLVQLADGAGAWQHFQKILSGSTGWQSPMRSSLWEPLAAQYRTLAVALPRNIPKDWIALGEFASRHHMPTEAGSFARINELAAAHTRDAMAAALREGRADPSTLYAVVDDDVWSGLVASPSRAGFLGVVDGFRIFAPSGCARCGGYALRVADARAGHAPRSDAWHFELGSTDLATLASGWSYPESWGTWSEGDAAELRLDLVPGNADLEFILTGTAFVSPEHPRQRVRVLLNGTQLGQLTYSDGSDNHERRIRVPRALAANVGAGARLRFEFLDATSPAVLGQSVDPRRLAFGIVSLRIEDVPATR